MTFAVVIVASAKADIAECAHWYETIRVGLGGEILKEIESIASHIVRHPDMYQKRGVRLRVAPLSVVPYQLYYAHVEQTAYILGLIPAMVRPRRKQSLALGRLRNLMEENR